MPLTLLSPIVILWLHLLSWVDQGWATESSHPAVAKCQLPFPTIVDRIAPSVVSISSTALTFDTPDARVNRQIGSGIIVDPRGHILTSTHLVVQTENIQVLLPDGLMVEASLIGADTHSDLAVLKIDVPDKRPLPALPLSGATRISIGEEVLALSSAMGFNQTVSRGIVSATDRYVSSAEPRESPRSSKPMPQ